MVKLSEHKWKGAKVFENQHPVVNRSLALAKVDGDLAFSAKKLISVSGKTMPTANAKAHLDRANSRLKDVENEVAKPPVITPIPEGEVVQVASSKRDNITSMLMDLQVKQQRERDSAARG